VARTPDPELKQRLLDEVVNYLAVNGVGVLSLRPMAQALNMSAHRLEHHFGAKEAMVAAALERAVTIQEDVRDKWFAEQPDLGQVELLRKWWGWLLAEPANLSLVRLGLEAATLEATSTGLAAEIREQQIGVWRIDIEDRLIAAGFSRADAAVEASLVKATFTGLVVDLMASGDRVRLTTSLDLYLSRLADRMAQETIRIRSVGVPTERVPTDA
jgi:AcrR family transcriptional regulator